RGPADFEGAEVHVDAMPIAEETAHGHAPAEHDQQDKKRGCRDARTHLPSGCSAARHAAIVAEMKKAPAHRRGPIHLRVLCAPGGVSQLEIGSLNQAREVHWVGWKGFV